MKKTTFKIDKMDCPSEEQLIRMKLDADNSIKKLEFDIPNRKLVIIHDGQVQPIENSIGSLNLGSVLIGSEETTDVVAQNDDTSDKKLLWIVFAINAGFFAIEIVTGIISQSMGLIADSLDMLADAIVYGMSLLVVGSTIIRKKQIAKLSGYFQLALALFGLFEVVRRFIGLDETPNYLTMIFVSAFALCGNAISLYLLQKKKSKEAHMEASYIFTSNDVIANIGVIVAGIIVYLTSSQLPDLIVGAIVFLIVLRGSFRILKLSSN